MLIKTGDAKILDIISSEEVQDEDKRKDILSTALEKAKMLIETKKDKELEN